MFGLPSIGDIVARLAVWVIAAPVHEFAHAFTADRLGDTTPEREGRLTLDPRVHLEPLGTLLVALFGLGWARPVGVNPYFLRFGARMGMLLVSLAGPLSNLLLAALFAVPVRLGLVNLARAGWVGVLPNVEKLWDVAIYLNLVLLFFNLLPVAPLDGFKVLLGLLPEDLAYRYAQTERWGPVILLVLLFLLPTVLPQVFEALIGRPAAWLYVLLTGR